MERKIIQRTNVNIDGFDTEVTQAQTDGFRIEDTATGKPIILRQFRYMYPAGQMKPRKEEILTESYIKHLENGLWADGMEMVMKPKVVFFKKGFTIFATCQAKKGNMIPYDAMETLRPLQETLQQEHGR